MYPMKKAFIMTAVCGLLAGGMASCGGSSASTESSVSASGEALEAVDTLPGKENIGAVLALYPKPMTVVGAEVDGRVNWLVVGHTGVLGHDRILLSMSKQHYTNRGIRASKRLSVNMVSRELLDRADYVGSVSGATVDKSNIFAYHKGANGSPVIDDSPLTMECEVVDIYETEGFDNFVCKVVNTYVREEFLGANGRPDYAKLKPVLFDFGSYTYIATGEVIGHCLQLDKAPRMCAKEAMGADAIVRLSRVEVDPKQVEAYLAYAQEVGEISLRTEPGVLTMYAVQDQEKPNVVTILETYASRAAYEKHVASAHFQRYKQETAKMVRRLELRDQTAVNPANRLTNYIAE